MLPPGVRPPTRSRGVRPRPSVYTLGGCAGGGRLAGLGTAAGGAGGRRWILVNCAASLRDRVTGPADLPSGRDVSARARTAGPACRRARRRRAGGADDPALQLQGDRQQARAVQPPHLAADQHRADPHAADREPAVGGAGRARLLFGVAVQPRPLLDGVLGAFLSLAASVLDGCDGEIARLKYQESALGCWIETFGDYSYYLAIFVGLTVGAVARTGWPGFYWLGAHLARGHPALVRAAHLPPEPDHRRPARQAARDRARPLQGGADLVDEDHLAHLVCRHALGDALRDHGAVAASDCCRWSSSSRRSAPTSTGSRWC